MLKRLSRFLGVAVGVLVLVAVGFVLGVEEVRYFVGYRLFPETTRDAAFDKYTTPKGLTLYHLGTIHGRHLDHQAYGLGHLQSVVETLRPDLLMVEVLPTEDASGNPASGPIEMPVVTLVAQRAQIPVAGIDWWTEAWLEDRSSADRDDGMFGNLLAALPPTGTVLVLTGYAHLLEFRPRYTAAGFDAAPFPGAEKARLFARGSEPFRLPDGLDAAFVRSVAWVDARIEATTSETSRQAYEGKRRNLQASRERLTSAETQTSPPPSPR